MNPLLSIDAQALQGTALFPGSIVARSPTSLALVGPWHLLFQALTGEISLPRNAICVMGVDARQLTIKGDLGVLPTRFAWPEGYTVSELLDLSARLLGLDKQASSREAKRVLEHFDLGRLSKQKLSRLLPLQMRQVGLAHSLLGSPRCVALQDPLAGLTTRDSQVMLEAIGLARVNRALIVSVAHAAPGSVERLLVETCHEVLVLEHGSVTLQGPPSRLVDRHGLFGMTITGEGARPSNARFLDALQEQGIVVRSFVSLPQGDSLVAGPIARLVVELTPSKSTLPLFTAAKSSDTTLLDLHALPNVE